MYWCQCKDIAMVFSFVLVAVFVHYSVAKPLEYNGPEENGKLNNPSLFEGDILLTPYQKQLLSGGDVSLTMGRKRGALKPGFYLIWPNGKIPYVIESQLSGYAPAIENAMREWENHTCIQFVPRTNELYYMKIRYGQGCASHIGYAPYPDIPLSLGTGCYSHGTILHELGHAIGFFHEQSRPDRDNYVNILFENIKSGNDNQFAKLTTAFHINSLGEAYDYDSIMHYGPQAFSKAEDLFTITSKNSNVTLKLNDHLSDVDIAQTNKLYNCP